MQEIRIGHTDVGSIDLESLKELAADPDVEAEIHSDGDVFISYRK